MTQTAQSMSIFIAFSAGLLSFVSPCVLPLIPSYLTYMTGVSFHDLTAQDSMAKVRWTTFRHSLAFVLGFTLVFTLMGASATSIGNLIAKHQDLILRIGGGIIILLGIHFLGIIQFRFLEKNKQLQIRRKRIGLFGSFLTGITFAAGWTPCIGPILASILLYASSTGSVSKGIILLAFYSLGLAIPFVFAGLAINTFLGASGWIKRHLRVINIISGSLLIVVGIAMIMGGFDVLIRRF
jgi:cytochrome c-type biogenesis protein